MIFKDLKKPRAFKMSVILMLLIFSLFSCKEIKPINTTAGPGQLDIYVAGENSIRLILKPVSYQDTLPENPALANQKFEEPIVSIRQLDNILKKKVGSLFVEISPEPLTVKVSNAKGELIQELAFNENGSLSFRIDNDPILGLGEGGPQPAQDVNWRELPVEFDRKGRFHNMIPRWQSNAYGSRNPVPFLMGTSGWGLFVAAPWVQVDLRNEKKGIFIPWRPEKENQLQTAKNQQEVMGKGLPPAESVVPGLFDIFVFDAHQPTDIMKDVSKITGPAVMPPKWALGYMQSHRTLKDEKEMISIVDTFREKKIPMDAVIYLGTGFCPQGWNEMQPSFEFNRKVFLRNPKEVIGDIKDRNVRVVLHVVPWDRDKLPTLHGSIPPRPGEEVDESHILSYWKQHVKLVNAGADAFWPDEGDWFNLYERIKRHQLYYQGPLSTKPNERPWSLHRNGYLGIAKWGGWVWSGDTDSAWKTLEAQIAVGINHSLSVSPYWGSDIGGFFPNPDKTREMYIRWFQFGAFCPSFRSHGRTWHTALPWGFGLSDMGVKEPNNTNDMTDEGAEWRVPSDSSMNNPDVEPITRKYAGLRYQLLPYNYTLCWKARETGMPLMRALWLHYPNDKGAIGIADEYLWGRDMLIAPVYEKDARTRQVYLPKGDDWYDWWTNEEITGGKYIERNIDLTTMPIYVRAGAIIPLDPIRQYAAQKANGPTTLRIYTGSDGNYTLYEDDGISLDYLEGKYNLTKIKWNNSERRLEIEPLHKGVEAPARTFKIELLPVGTTKEVEYRGENLKISF